MLLQNLLNTSTWRWLQQKIPTELHSHKQTPNLHNHRQVGIVGQQLNNYGVALTRISCTFPEVKCSMLHYLEAASVNRFGEISPLWPNLRSIRQSFDGLFRQYQSIFSLLWQTLCKKVAIFQCFKYTNIEKIIQTSGHTGSSSFQGAAISNPLLGLLPPGCCHSDQKWAPLLTLPAFWKPKIVSFFRLQSCQIRLYLSPRFTSSSSSSSVINLHIFNYKFKL